MATHSLPQSRDLQVARDISLTPQARFAIHSILQEYPQSLYRWAGETSPRLYKLFQLLGDHVDPIYIDFIAHISRQFPENYTLKDQLPYILHFLLSPIAGSYIEHYITCTNDHQKNFFITHVIELMLQQSMVQTTAPENTTSLFSDTIITTHDAAIQASH